MKLTATYSFSFPDAVARSNGIDTFEITLTSSSGHLNNQTGSIIDPKELRDLMLNWIEEKFRGVESISEVCNLEYLPKTTEIITERLWEWIEEILPFSAKLVGLKVVTTDGNFVQYNREEPVLVREPQPQTKPQTKLRKRRKKTSGQKRKNTNRSRRRNPR